MDIMDMVNTEKYRQILFNLLKLLQNKLVAVGISLIHALLHTHTHTHTQTISILIIEFLLMPIAIPLSGISESSYRYKLN
jgi:hypothetical protein